MSLSQWIAIIVVTGLFIGSVKEGYAMEGISLLLPVALMAVCSTGFAIGYGINVFVRIIKILW